MELFRVFAFLGCFLVYALGNDDGEEIISEYVSRRPELEVCPENAVCGDIFFMRRLLRDGTRRAENRHISNCKCPGLDGCNFHKDHLVFQSLTHREALCKPVREYRNCRPGQSARNLRMYSMNLGGQSYFEIMCLCPRHLNPSEESGRDGKSTKETYPISYDSPDSPEVRPYSCNGMREEFLRNLKH